MNNLNQNNFNFGETIYLKSRADRQAAKRYGKAHYENSYF
jgi:hypothetical protein